MKKYTYTITKTYSEKDGYDGHTSYIAFIKAISEKEFKIEKKVKNDSRTV